MGQRVLEVALVVALLVVELIEPLTGPCIEIDSGAFLLMSDKILELGRTVGMFLEIRGYAAPIVFLTDIMRELLQYR